jgi:hypothetical protein
VFFLVRAQADNKPLRDRFRTLTFNLGQHDRVVLHRRIASSAITPKELSTMSSTELASEEAKQSIKQAEKEALEHSILQKTLVPRAKITHKGFEDIEDINGEMAKAREREQEDQNRRERERLARLRPVEPRAGSASGSVPPESPGVPLTPQTPSWGAPPPPPPPVHVVASPVDGAGRRPPVNPLFVPSASDVMTPIGAEPELNLADLINIDDEAGSLAEPMPTPVSQSGPEILQPSQGALEQSPSASTGISPFAANVAKPETRERSASFDLNSLWIGEKRDAPADDASSATRAQPPEEAHQDVVQAAESFGPQAQDQDFDMLLDEDDDAKEPALGSDGSPEEQERNFAASPQVWSGQVSLNMFILFAFTH